MDGMGFLDSGHWSDGGSLEMLGYANALDRTLTNVKGKIEVFARVAEKSRYFMVFWCLCWSFVVTTLLKIAMNWDKLSSMNQITTHLLRMCWIHKPLKKPERRNILRFVLHMLGLVNAKQTKCPGDMRVLFTICSFALIFMSISNIFAKVIASFLWTAWRWWSHNRSLPQSGERATQKQGMLRRCRLKSQPGVKQHKPQIYTNDTW